MNHIADDILRAALTLPAEERAALAASLIDSLETEVDEDAEAQWQAEIACRINEIDAGTVTLIPWSEARHRITGR